MQEADIFFVEAVEDLVEGGLLRRRQLRQRSFLPIPCGNFPTGSGPFPLFTGFYALLFGAQPLLFGPGHREKRTAHDLTGATEIVIRHPLPQTQLLRAYSGCGAHYGVDLLHLSDSFRQPFGDLAH
jgi:hypothetical protein